MLSAVQIIKSFAGKRVLGPLDVECPQGRTTILLGLSGCGKSTLLRLLMGLTWPDSGTISIEGTVLTRSNVLAVRRKLGYVTQDGGLFPHLTALDNILLAARYFKQESEARQRLGPLLEMTKLHIDMLQRYPSELSGGQKQRVSMIRALVLDPGIVLLDEPMGALDPMIRADLQSDLKTIFTDLQKTVVLVTHDLAEAAFLGDHIVMMNAGNIVQQSTFADLVRYPAAPFVSDFLAAQRPIPWPAEDGDPTHPKA